MTRKDDFRPRKNTAESDLAATVPDLFAAIQRGNKVPQESTCIPLYPNGTISFPGQWQLCDSNSSLIQLLNSAQNCAENTSHYKERNSLTAILSIGGLKLSERAELLVERFITSGARALHDFELSTLQAALSETRSATGYELSAGSIEELGGKLVLHLLGRQEQNKMKEALIIFPFSQGCGHLSLRAIKPEFPVYLDHLRHALKSVDWIQ